MAKKRAAPENKDGTRGGFRPGVSGNPGGRPKGVREYVRGLIGEEGGGAYDICWEIAQGKRTAKRWVSGGGDVGPIEVDTTPSIKEQYDAAAFLIERLQGKATQPVDANVSIQSLTDEQLKAKLDALSQAMAVGT